MTWWLRPIQATASGAAITLGSTVVSCALALQVEKSANRFFFWLVPYRYANVEKAYGLTRQQLESVRHYRTTTTGDERLHAQSKLSTDGFTAAGTRSGDATTALFSTATTFSTDTGYREETRPASPRESLDKRPAKRSVVVLPSPEAVLGQEVLSAALTG